MARFAWQLMRQHAENYDGTCVYCGGKCRNSSAVEARKEVRNLIEQSEAGKETGVNMAYLRRQYNLTLTYRFTK